MRDPCGAHFGLRGEFREDSLVTANDSDCSRGLLALPLDAIKRKSKAR